MNNESNNPNKSNNINNKEKGKTMNITKKIIDTITEFCTTNSCEVRISPKGAFVQKRDEKGHFKNEVLTPMEPQRRERKPRVPKVTDDEFASMLKFHENNIRKTAEHLKISYQTALKYARRLGVVTLRVRRAPVRNISDEEFRATYESCNGSRKKMSEVLGVAAIAVSHKAKVLGVVFKRGKVPGEKAPKESKPRVPKVSDDQIREAYETCHGSQKEMCKVLGVSSSMMVKAGKRLGLVFKRGRRAAAKE